MEVFAFRLTPYPYLVLDDGRTHKSVRVTYPNSHFDPVKGHALYNRHTDERKYAARADAAP
jgi:hypothetical protein